MIQTKIEMNGVELLVEGVYIESSEILEGIKVGPLFEISTVHDGKTDVTSLMQDFYPEIEDKVLYTLKNMSDNNSLEVVYDLKEGFEKLINSDEFLNVGIPPIHWGDNIPNDEADNLLSAAIIIFKSYDENTVKEPNEDVIAISITTKGIRLVLLNEVNKLNN
jgi:hypothetical protein